MRGHGAVTTGQTVQQTVGGTQFTWTPTTLPEPAPQTGAQAGV